MLWKLAREDPRGTGRHCLYLTTSLLQTPPEEDPQGETYAQVKPSRLRKAGHVSPSVMSREQLNTEYEQAEEGQGANNQVGPVLHRPAGFPKQITYLSLTLSHSRLPNLGSPRM